MPAVRRPLPDEPRQRRGQPEIVEHGRAQLPGEEVEIAVDLLRSGPARVDLPRLRPPTARVPLERQPQRGELLAEVVVEIAGDARALVLLRGDDASAAASVTWLCAGARVRDLGLERAGPFAHARARSLPGPRAGSRPPAAAPSGRAQSWRTRAPSPSRDRGAAAVEPGAVSSAGETARRRRGRARGPCCSSRAGTPAARSSAVNSTLEVPADDLARRVAEHALRAGVPRVDRAILVHREDRVVDRARRSAGAAALRSAATCSSAWRRSVMSWNVMTTPSMRSSVVRYGRMRIRCQRPSAVWTSRSTFCSSSSTRCTSL